VTRTASAFSARQCREFLQRSAEPDPASYDPRLAAQMVAVGEQGVAGGRLSSHKRRSFRQIDSPEADIGLGTG